MNPLAQEGKRIFGSLLVSYFFHAIFEAERNCHSVTMNTAFFVKISSNDSLVARPYPQKNLWYPCLGRYPAQLTHEVSPDYSSAWFGC